MLRMVGPSSQEPDRGENGDVPTHGIAPSELIGRSAVGEYRKVHLRSGDWRSLRRPIAEDGMSEATSTTRYRKLVERTARDGRRHRSPAEEVDRLIRKLHDGTREQGGADPEFPPSPIDQLRRLARDELIPTFHALAVQYAASDIAMTIDASNFLAGGRTLRMTFRHGEFRSELEGTVTEDCVAFVEVKYSPVCQGHLGDGPALRLRRLNQETFRDFVCHRLALLLRAALRGD